MYSQIYVKILPFAIGFSGTSGLLTGIYATVDFGIPETHVVRTPPSVPVLSKRNDDDYEVYTSSNKTNEDSMTIYKTLVGYSAIGVLSGIAYPVSFPLFAYHALNANP
jgi:hypothetical protein